jgi:ribonuclease VapC
MTFGNEGARDLKLFLAEAEIEIDPVTLDQVEVAREAYRRSGKGSHPAALNFSDCFAYALARIRGEPLLFKATTFHRRTSRRADAAITSRRAKARNDPEMPREACS